MVELPDLMKLSPWAQLSEICLSSARVKETRTVTCKLLATTA